MAINPAAENEIAENTCGRGLPATYPLLERMTERYGLGREEAHKQIHACLSQVVSLDGQDAVILSRRPINERRAEHNPNGALDVHQWLTVNADAIGTIKDQFAAEYAGSGDNGDCDA